MWPWQLPGCEVIRCLPPQCLFKLQVLEGRTVHEEAERRAKRAESRAADAATAVQRAECEAAEHKAAASTASRKAEDVSAAAQRLRGQLEALQAEAEAGSSSHGRQLRVGSSYVLQPAAGGLLVCSPLCRATKHMAEQAYAFSLLTCPIGVDDSFDHATIHETT